MLYRDGDKNALEVLVTQNQGIIHKLLKRFYFNLDDFDDLVQEANIGLIYAAKKYNFIYIDRVKFISYACYWINQKIGRYLKKNNTDDQERLDAPIGVEGNASIIDFLNSSDNVEDEVIERRYQLELKRDIKDSMYKVNTLEERETLELLYGLNLTHPLNLIKSGEILSISPEAVRLNQRRALSKLRRNRKRLPIKKYWFELNEIQTERKYNNVDNLVYNLGAQRATFKQKLYN